jgi:hypothetical protein
MTFPRNLLGAALVLSIAALPVCAQVSGSKPMLSTTGNSVTAKAMRNADVIALSAAGLPDEIIIAKIHSAPVTDFDTSLDGLKSLKAANVSNVILRAMIDPHAAQNPTTTAADTSSEAGTDSADDPLVPHPPGIYILASGRDGSILLAKLEHTVPKQEKTTGAFLSGITYGITKGHVKVVLDGAHAPVETPNSNPTFYIYIPEDNATFGGNSISVKDFALMKFDVKSGRREVSTVSISMWGASAGTDEKARQGFSSERVKPGIYKLTLLSPLSAGQYAFQQSGSQGSASGQQNTGTYFDFGILGNQ